MNKIDIVEILFAAGIMILCIICATIYDPLIFLSICLTNAHVFMLRSIVKRQQIRSDIDSILFKKMQKYYQGVIKQIMSNINKVDDSKHDDKEN